MGKNNFCLGWLATIPSAVDLKEKAGNPSPPPSPIPLHLCIGLPHTIQAHVKDDVPVNFLAAASTARRSASLVNVVALLFTYQPRPVNPTNGHSGPLASRMFDDCSCVIDITPLLDVSSRLLTYCRRLK